MNISYRELNDLLSAFNRGYHDDNNMDVFSRESRPIYLNPQSESQLRFLRYVHLANDSTAIDEPLIITFDAEDFKTIKSHNDSTLTLILNVCKEFGYVGVDREYYKYDYPDVPEEVINVINEIYRSFYHTKTIFITMCIDPTMVEGMDTKTASSTIIKYVYDRCGSEEMFNKWKYLMFSGEFSNSEVLNELSKLFGKSGRHTLYYSKAYTDYKDALILAKDNSKSAEIADKSYCIVFDESWLTGYEDFAKEYGTYKNAYDHLLQCLRSNNKDSRSRFLISERNKASQIKCIEYLLAWITVTSGYCFLFESNKLSDGYHKFMNQILTGDMLASDLRFRISCNMPVIQNNKWLLGIADLKLNTERLSVPVPTPVIITSVNRSIRNWKAVPLELIMREIKCTHEVGNIKNTGVSYFGFYPGNSLFDRKDLMSGTEYNASSFEPVNICDYLIDDFQKRCSEIKANLESIHANQAVIDFYSPANYEKLFESYLYSFSVIFSQYVGNSNWYSLNNIFILPMEHNGKVINVACVMDYDTKYSVRPFLFIDDKPLLSPESDITVDYVYSPQFLIDFEEKVIDEYGIITSEVNSKFIECVKLLERAKPAKPVIPVAKQLEAKEVKKVSLDDAINQDNIYDWLYPVINICHNYIDFIDNSVIPVIPEDFLEDVHRYAMELLSAYYHILTVNVSNARTITLNHSTDVALVNNVDYKDYLRDLICRGLCESAVRAKTDVNMYFSHPLFNLNGLRYVSYWESFIKWNGRIKASITGSSFPSIYPAFIKGRR